MSAEPHEYLDDATRHWMTDTDHSTPLSRRGEEVDDDVQSAYREATYQKASAADLEQASPHLDILAQRYGSLKNGIDYYLRADQGFKDDPIATAAFLKRDFKARGAFAKADPAPRPEPPEYLDPKARSDWQRQQDVRDAVAGAPREAWRRQQLEEAEPQLARVRRQYDSVAKQAINAAAFEQTAASYPEFADTIAEMYLARQPQAPAPMAVPETAYLNDFLGDVVSRNILPGIDALEDHVAAEISRLTSSGQHKGGWQELLVNAYWNVREGIKADIDRAATDHERAEGERARLASRSLSAAPGGLDDNRPYEPKAEDPEGDSIFDAARRAYHSVTGRTRV
jgi:hypothetical protein